MPAISAIERRAVDAVNLNLAQVGQEPVKAAPWLTWLMELLAGCMAQRKTAADIQKTCIDCYNEEGSRGENRRTRAILRHGLKKLRKSQAKEEALDVSVDSILAAGANASEEDFAQLVAAVPEATRSVAMKAIGGLQEV